ncbi:unnamed protein product [Ranitomeya imitator]|uniref:G-protein coupled receptors family 1 profile domain-containing protein n=1 Tax=Ranitomeya imitator TaxID=111125 RepID=A0ABN9L3K7_9NEOB|nr:unnamed protein product [Ranitomeya imitator]
MAGIFLDQRPLLVMAGILLDQRPLLVMAGIFLDQRPLLVMAGIFLDQRLLLVMAGIFLDQRPLLVMAGIFLDQRPLLVMAGIFLDQRPLLVVAGIFLEQRPLLVVSGIFRFLADNIPSLREAVQGKYPWQGATHLPAGGRMLARPIPHPQRQGSRQYHRVASTRIQPPGVRRSTSWIKPDWIQDTFGWELDLRLLGHSTQAARAAGPRKDAVAQIQHWNIDKEQGRQTQAELNSKAANELTKTPEGGSPETAIPLVTTEICCNLSTTESTPGQSEDSACPEEKRGWNPELQKNGETKEKELICWSKRRGLNRKDNPYLFNIKEGADKLHPMTTALKNDNVWIKPQFSQFFVLSGITDNLNVQMMLFVFFMMVYIFTVLGNTVIIMVITKTDRNLNIPMYIFLQHLSFCDLCYSSVITSEMLVNSLHKYRLISLVGCSVQMFIFVTFVAIECFLLGIMAYDRGRSVNDNIEVGTKYSTMYCTSFDEAIRRVKKLVCAKLVAAASVGSITNGWVHTTKTFSLTFCHSNIIKHFYCDIPPLLKLSCSDTTINGLLLVIFGILTSWFSLVIILISYGYIISTVIKIRSGQGRLKVFSTCASHFTAVSMFYGALFYMYLRPATSYSEGQDRVASIFYTVMIPALNPLIYSLRNQEVKEAVRKLRERLFDRETSRQKKSITLSFRGGPPIQSGMTPHSIASFIRGYL